MRVYRRLARSKKGMSAVFGGLFFVIILLMGFNVMLWGLIQYDAYTSVVTKMGLRDQQASSENLVPISPGATDFTSNSFNITVNNVGGVTVSIARIYITTISGSSQCTTAPCIVNPPLSSVYFSNGNIPAGQNNFKIKVTGILINDGGTYQVALATTRGRLFNLYYPWPVTPPSGGGGGNGQFVTNVGPLAIYFDFKSFNFTQDSQTSSTSAFCMPPTTVVLWIKVSNTSTASDVILEGSTMMEMQPYSANGFGQFVRTWIVSPTSINPTSITPYNQGTAPYDLPAASQSGGPGPAKIVYFGGTSQGGTGGASFKTDDNWITFIGFYYIFQGQPQGETVPFMDFKTTSGYPGTC